MPPIAGFFARARSLWRGLSRRDALEADIREEFLHHIELRTEHLIREGLPPKEAARRARIEFGHVEGLKEDARASRGLRVFDQMRFSWLDVKLGFRMLTKYPGLSLVSVIGMSVAIAIAAGYFAAIGAFMDPTLPLPEGDRIVSLQNTNIRNPGNPDRQVLHDFLLWRDELRSVRDLGAFRTDSRNLITADERADLVRIAEMSAAGFRVARVPPLLGRPLLEDDERPGAPPVVVIGYAEWQRRFDADPDIVGRTVRLGTTVHTVVGVMPEGFRFPISHDLWVPLRLDPSAHERGTGPSIEIFGRLADGSTFQEARAELATMGRRTAAEFPETNEHLRPVVLPYTYPYLDVDSPAMAWAFRGIQLGASLLLVLVAVNVAILVYARTATRTGEIAVRSALGASRRRVVGQLFAEALVQSSIAAVIGLSLAALALKAVGDFQDRTGDWQMPFWMDLGLSPGVVAYVAGLAILAGGIVGVLPALKATGRRVQINLQQLSTRGSQMQLGRTWAALIVTQVAIAVAVLPFATWVAGQSVLRGVAEPGYPADEILSATLSMEREESPPAAEAEAYERAFEARFRDRAAELVRRLEAEPAVAAVTFATHFPGREWFERVEVQGTGSAAPATGEPEGRWVHANRVDPGLLDLFDVPVVAGRGFQPADGREGANVALVDRVFADRLLEGGQAVGRQVRVLSRTQGNPDWEVGPWLEVVGVVPSFTVPYDFESPDPKLYLPLGLADAPTVLSLAVRVRGGATAELSGRLRDVSAAVDPGLQLHELRSAADAERQRRLALLALGLLIVAVTVTVLLLSAAGIYAMMSFTVARRRREIGIRSALGAEPRRILAGVFGRAGAQLGAGVIVGIAAAAGIGRLVGVSFEGGHLLLLPAVAALMTAVGLLAALGPARRGLAVQPTEALREE